MKQSLKDFLITFIVSVVIFAIVALFLIRAAESLMGDVVGGIRAPGANGQSVSAVDDPASASNKEEESSENKKSVTLLFVVTDDKGRADAAYLLGVDPESKSAAMVHIPGNTGMTEAGVTYPLSSVDAAKQPGILADFIASEVGAAPDYYMVVTRTGFSNWVDFIGGVRYSVPRDMAGFDKDGSRAIDLHAGDQVLSGSQAAQMLAFSDYGDSRTARDEMLLGFGRAFASAVLTPSGFTTAKSIYYNVSRHMNTNLSESELARVGPALFRFNEFGPNVVRIPGSTDAKGYYSISRSRVEPMFEIFK